jgi:hypothetical protein
MTKTTWPLAATLTLALSAAPALADQVGYQAGAGNPNTVAVSPQTPLPVTVAPSTLSGAVSTDASGTVAAGGTYQTVFAANAARRGCMIQNPPTATEALNVKLGTMAAPFVVPIGGAFRCDAGYLVVTDAITVTAATTAHAFSAVSQ